MIPYRYTRESKTMALNPGQRDICKCGRPKRTYQLKCSECAKASHAVWKQKMVGRVDHDNQDALDVEYDDDNQGGDL